MCCCCCCLLFSMSISLVHAIFIPRELYVSRLLFRSPPSITSSLVPSVDRYQPDQGRFKLGILSDRTGALPIKTIRLVDSDWYVLGASFFLFTPPPHTWLGVSTLLPFPEPNRTDEHTENNALCVYTDDDDDDILSLLILRFVILRIHFFPLFTLFLLISSSSGWLVRLIFHSTAAVFSARFSCFLLKRRSNLAFEKVECLKFSQKSTYSTSTIDAKVHTIDQSGTATKF